MVMGLLVLAAAALVLARGGSLPWWGGASPTGAVYTTTTGERAEVHLTDGTTVELAPESRLTVAFAEDTRRRRVRLDDGRGFFEVARDTTHPFVVQTENAEVRVLGTAFDVRAYKDAGGTQVVVSEGRVAVHASDGWGHPDSSVVLTAKQRALLSTGGRLEVSAVRSLKTYSAWREGQIVFRDVPLREVLHQLERWHDFDAKIADSSLARRPLTATFASRRPLEETLDALVLAVKARYERTGPGAYTFFPRLRTD
jgi:transmembrane sensor